MGKSILCSKLVELLPPECPLHQQCSIFKGTCNVPKEECLVCRDPEAARPYDCYCDLKQAKKTTKHKKGK